METIILTIIALLAILIICSRVKKLVDTISGKPVQGACNCGTCEKSCSYREKPEIEHDAKTK